MTYCARKASGHGAIQAPICGKPPDYRARRHTETPAARRRRAPCLETTAGGAARLRPLKLAAAAGPAAGAAAPNSAQLPVALPYVPTHDGIVLDVLAQLPGRPSPGLPPDVVSSIASVIAVLGSSGIGT